MISFVIGLIMLCITSKRSKGIRLTCISAILFGIACFITAKLDSGVNKTPNLSDTNVAETKEQPLPSQRENNQAPVASTSSVWEQVPTTKTNDDNNQTLNTTADAAATNQNDTETGFQNRNPNLDPEKNIKRITTYLKLKKIKWKLFGERLCISDNYCSLYVGSVLIRAVGGTVNVEISNEVSSTQYIKTCAMVLSGLSGITQEQTQNHVMQAFSGGAHGTFSKYRIGDVDMTIRTSSDSRLLCSFFRKTQ